MAKVPTVPLSTPDGPVDIPQLGFGVWQVPDSEVAAAVASALDAGYRSIDTAQMYGNEDGVGRALAATDVAREELFVTTKVWPDDYGRKQTKAAFDRSMERLALDRLDLYLLHWPVPAQGRFTMAWAALRAIRDEGRVRAIGVCNFHAEHLQRLHDETQEWPAINQVELHPYLQQRELRRFNAERDIRTEAWSPLASGGAVLADSVITQIAKDHGVTPAQTIIRWHLQLGNVVIPKSVTPSRIAENVDVYGFELTDEDMARIATLDRDERTGPNPEVFTG